MKRLNFFIDEDRLKLLRSVAFIQGKGVATVLRKAIDFYLAHHLPRNGDTLSYKGFTLVMTPDAEARSIKGTGKGPFDVGLNLYADSIGDLERLFHFEVERWEKIFSDLSEKQT